MRHSGSQSHKYRDMTGFRVFKCLTDHVISLLLVGRFEAWNHGEVGVEPGVLLILGRVLRRVVACHDHQSAVGSGDGRVHESVRTYVHADVFHADQCSFSGIRHTECRFHSGFFVGAPFTMQAALLSERMRLNIFRNFSRWSSRISEDAGQPCVQCT